MAVVVIWVGIIPPRVGPGRLGMGFRAGVRTRDFPVERFPTRTPLLRDLPRSLLGTASCKLYLKTGSRFIGGIVIHREQRATLRLL